MTAGGGKMIAIANDLSAAKVSAFITEWSKLFLH